MSEEKRIDKNIRNIKIWPLTTSMYWITIFVF